MSWFANTNEQQPATKKKFANISDDQINSNQQAVPVKYLAGRCYVGGDFISPAYNPRAQAIQTSTGKNQNSTTGYKYFCDFALVFCMGGRAPVDTIYKVIVDSDIVWKSPNGVTRTVGTNKEVITVPDFGVIHLYWGTETSPIDSVLLTPRGVAGTGVDTGNSTTWPPLGGGAGNTNPFSGHYDKHPAYRGQCYAVFINWKLGRDRVSVPNIQLELKRGCPWIGGTFKAADDKGVNPIAILYDWLTDERFGMGMTDTNIPATVWNAAYAQAESFGARLSPVISGQSDFRQVVAELLEYYDGWIRNNGGYIEVGMWSHGAVVPVKTLLDDDLLAEPELEPQGWTPTVNELTVVYRNRRHHFNDYTEVHRDPNNFRITGGPRSNTFQRPWLTDANLAKRYVTEMGKILALPYTRGQLTVKKEWIDNWTGSAYAPILVGSIIQYNSGFYGLSFLLRVLEIEYAADDAASALLTVEWDRSRWPSLFIPDPFEGPGGFTIGPRAIEHAKITEIPYNLADHRFDTQVVVLATRANTEVAGFRTWLSLDAGATYNVVPDDTSTSFFAVYGTVITTAMGDKTTTFTFDLYGVDLETIVSQTGDQMKNDNLLCFIEDEVISIGPITVLGSGTYSALIQRNRFGTIGVVHAIGTPIYFLYRDHLRLIDNASFEAGVVCLFKLQPFTPDTDYDLASVVPISYTITAISSTPLPIPTLNPPAGQFVTSVTITCTAGPAGTVTRFTQDGSAVRSSSPLFPTSVVLVNSATLHVQYFSADGRFSPVLTAVYSEVPTPPAGSPPPVTQVAAVSYTFSGTQNRTSGNLTLTCATGGATIKYKKNAGAQTNYSTPLALVSITDFDYVEFWASKAGSSDSTHRFFDNSRYRQEGGGGTPPGGHGGFQ